MRLREYPDLLPERIEGAPRPVGRAVVDDDDLEVAIRLFQNARDRAGDGLFPVPDRQNNRHQRFASGGHAARIVVDALTAKWPLVAKIRRPRNGSGLRPAAYLAR